ncbi:hypothetical protein CONPUDRAFT_138220 [Coniophora puteana RWD-64-598 SS2]|uniref:Uncharacterized protein n=1 Tax=Coniophora puteana (strain RWD-64-598) TaxID=741705 RepID=A0A5M3MIV0_CONPW|nr:uncharacterized protein CONPUDRAFT_138220 [Coniophora puteana RWD-64-598 SS2]EIW78956.1 hypothetical protein CONPUDRAFT_138220 [Coniophora puteana RWD-64-598 SS2]
MQEFFMMALIAHVTNRSHVFNDYVWDWDHYPYSTFNGSIIPSRIPLSAIAGGPMVGGALPPGDKAPRAVSSSFFLSVCPNATVLNVREVQERAGFDGSESAPALLNLWFETLTAIEDPCVQLAHYSPAIFDYMAFGDKKRMLPIWLYLSKTPAVTHWQWSPLILDAFKANVQFFMRRLSSFSSWFFSDNALDSRDIIPGLLAIHVRRGDFEKHCHHLANWSSDWNAFNSFPEFVEKFEVPADHGWGETTPENVAKYERRCYPDITQIIDKVSQVRLEHAASGEYAPLNRLFIMTNGPIEWIAELKYALSEAGQKWESISSSRDLELNAEQKYVAQAVDMLVAERAQVFIGNGWSSLTSNVNMLRMAKTFEPDSCRFW